MWRRKFISVFGGAAAHSDGALRRATGCKGRGAGIGLGVGGSGREVAHCGCSAGALARLSVEYAMPGVVGVGLVQCKLSPEKEVMIRS
jgi:hypothetical protein